MASSAMTHTNVTTDQLALLSLKSQIISTPLTYWMKTGLRLRPFVIGLELLLALVTSEIPKEISNLVELEVLTLDFNSFSGSHDMEIFNISGLRIIDLTVNNLSGSLPPNIELAGNKHTGLIPNSLGYLTHLQILNLVGNNLTSDSLLSLLTSITNCKNLSVLSLSFNPLNGMLPASVGNLSTSLLKFHAKSCKIKGRIANEIGNFSSLLFLDISENNLVGSIPTTIGNLRNLQRFNLSNNKLTGFIGDHICKLQHLGEIYLGQNKLSGSLPNCLGNITSLREIHLGSNKVSSNISPNLGNLQDLLVLDVSSNNMVGSLPPEIGNLKVITKMDLLMNQFTHGIPREIGELQNSLYLSLRHNKLQGSIPDSESNMVGLEFLDLSHNNISGTIPKILEKLQNLKYFNVSINKFYATDDLSESNLIGSGSIDSVYKGILKSGTAIVVKLFNLQVDAAFKSFDMECEVLRSFRHRNLVKVITSCSNLDFKALVLEYMPNRCLDKYLYSHNYFLDIKQILSIMINVACALEYLHHGCLSLVIHCDLKPSNVLLDEDLVAHPSNFGISKLLSEDQSDLYTKTLATLGYIAPEYGLEGLVSTKCDVYSYGVMLLGTFTWRKPNEFEGDFSLKQWVSYSLPDAVMDVVDANLVTQMGGRLQMELDVVASIMKVALVVVLNLRQEGLT
ncbi:putative acid phosphatase 1-like [Capsicum annuum]|nr:putative acid phosphatase 1-like [Capsicum annuum]